jgi:hypothetical protein
LLSSRFWARAAGTVFEVRCRVRPVTIDRQARKFPAAPVALKADRRPREARGDFGQALLRATQVGLRSLRFLLRDRPRGGRRGPCGRTHRSEQ